MTPERWAKIEALFHRACECEPADRVALLNELCQDDPDLRSEVEALLASEESAGDHLHAAVQEGLENVGFPMAGETISHYRILDGLAGGGMGLVYRAEDIRLGRRVALKFLPEESAKDSAALGRFQREARAASALEHPNICPIYEFGEHEGQPFLVMQLLEGQSLRELISAAIPGEPPLSPSKLLDLAIQITAGLDAAHSQGIIHRDIKPANLFVTSQGQAKILDFGLAKLTSVVRTPGDSSIPLRHEDGEVAQGATTKAMLPAASDLSISLTGVAMGTAGYMSPEQVRGEKLDARTDLFSFGLVLYEMATGQRAFKGDTGPVLQNAILNQIPTPVRELNPEIPAKLERVIKKALEKDRATRYQTAEELRGDLGEVKQDMQPARGVAWKALAGGISVLSVAMLIFWFSTHKQPSAKRLSEPKLRQLTVNSFENSVKSGAISPDGKYLAYTDAKHIYLQLMETGKTEELSQPDALKGEEAEWEIGPWFPNSTKFLVNVRPSTLNATAQTRQENTSIWAISVFDQMPHKLRSNAVAYSISPDGSSVSFGTNKGRVGDREIWLMALSGDEDRKLFETDEGSSIFGLIWSSDGKRVLYTKTDRSGATLIVRDLKGGAATPVLGPSEMRQVLGLIWLADGRLLYSVAEPESFFGSACNFWKVRLDGDTGKPTEKPSRLTNWSGFCMSSPSVTRDGKELVFLRWAGHTSSYMADLVAGGNRIVRPKHFPLTESSDAVTDWTPDSKTIILVSNRSGQFGIYKQFLDSDMAEPLVTQGYGRDPRMSPDGKSVVYLGMQENGPLANGIPEPVMRVAIAGGPSRRLFTASSGSVLTCARSPSHLCAIGEPTEDGKQLAVSSFDPLMARGSELFRFSLDSNDSDWNLDLSPDGSRFAAISSTAGPIYIFSARGEVLQLIHVKRWSNFHYVVWAADSKSLFVTTNTQGGRVVLHVDLQGNAAALWENTGGSGETLAHPSPDGRHLEFDGWTTSGNMWLMENF